MSCDLIKLVMRKDIGDGVRKAILLALADIDNPKGDGITTSIPTIAAMTGFSTRTVQTHMKALQGVQILHPIGTVKCPSGRITAYRINVEGVRALPDWRASRGAANAPLEPARGEAPAPVQQMHPASPAPLQAEIQPSGAVNAPLTHPSGAAPAPKPIELYSHTPVPMETPVRVSSELRSSDTAVGKPKAKRSSREGTLIPLDWRPTERHIEIAANHGYTPRQALYMAHCFETYWRGRKDSKARKCDWMQTWRTWVTTQKRWQVEDGAKHWKAPAALAAPIKALRPEEWVEFVGYFDAGQGWPIDIGPAPNKPDFAGPDELYRGDVEARKAWKKANGLNGFHPEKTGDADLFGGIAL